MAVNPLRRLHLIHDLLLALWEQGQSAHERLDVMSQGIDELNAQVATLKASEAALLQREDARDAAEKARADALQAALDDLKAHPAATTDLSGPIAAIAAIQAEMDAAAQPAAGGTPPA